MSHSSIQLILLRILFVATQLSWSLVITTFKLDQMRYSAYIQLDDMNAMKLMENLQPILMEWLAKYNWSYNSLFSINQKECQIWIKKKRIKKNKSKFEGEW